MTRSTKNINPQIVIILALLAYSFIISSCAIVLRCLKVPPEFLCFPHASYPRAVRTDSTPNAGVHYLAAIQRPSIDGARLRPRHFQPLPIRARLSCLSTYPHSPQIQENRAFPQSAQCFSSRIYSRTQPMPNARAIDQAIIKSFAASSANRLLVAHKICPRFYDASGRAILCLVIFPTKSVGRCRNVSQHL